MTDHQLFLELLEKKPDYWFEVSTPNDWERYGMVAIESIKFGWVEGGSIGVIRVEHSFKGEMTYDDAFARAVAVLEGSVKKREGACGG